MPMDISNYPDNWKDISQYIRFGRANGKCEGGTHYPDCRAKHGSPHPVTKSIVVLTTAHMDHDTTNNDYDNLRSLCQRCHLAEDQELHAANRRETARRKREEAGQLAMFDIEQ